MQPAVKGIPDRKKQRSTSAESYCSPCHSSEMGKRDGAKAFFVLHEQGRHERASSEKRARTQPSQH